MMIDWVTALIPFHHETLINGGNVVSVSPDGSVEWAVEKRMRVEGSYGSSMQVRSEHKESPCSHIRIDGNPVKFLQGHNVWGSNDLHGLLTCALKRILSQVLPDADLSLLHVFVAVGTISRIDLNCMYDLGSSSNVNAWLRAASEAASISHRGRGQFSGDTLYWGKKSRRWALKAYWKGGEIKKHKPRSVASGGYSPSDLESVQEYANRALRVELVLRGMELAKLNLADVQFWKEGVSEKVYNRYIGKLEFSQNMKVAENLELPDDFPPRLVGPVRMWQEGHDLRSIYSLATWYRYKKDILNRIGLDISLPPPVQRLERSNVVPLVRVLEAVPMGVPEWAKGTHLYYEPPAYPPLALVK